MIDTYTDIELDIIDLEPPGLFPPGHESLWGKVRQIFAEYLSVQVKEVLDQWYINLDPRTVDINDIDEWEYMVGIPIGQTTRTLDQRRALVLAHLSYGAFTRTKRQALVESALTVTFGPAATFGPAGISLSGGIPLYSGVTSLGGLYTITEDIPNFTYTVFVDPSADVPGLQRVLEHATPAGIKVVVTSGATPPPTTRHFGDGTFGSGTFGS